MRSSAFLFLLFILLNFQMFPQEIAGKIISSTEADSLFGIPDISKNISSITIAELSENSEYLFITFYRDEFFFANETKEVLYPRKITLSGEEVFHVYSSSVIADLIRSGESADVKIEKRKSILTLTSGNYTLEFGLLCPPYCITK